MKRNKTKKVFDKAKILLLPMLLFSLNITAQKKERIIVIPSTSKIASVLNDNIRKQIIADWHDDINFGREKNNGINRRYLVSSAEKQAFERTNQRVGLFFISTEKLIQLLYNGGSNSTKIYGFNLFFTKNKSEIILVKADSNFKNLSTDFELLNTNSKPSSNILAQTKNLPIAQIRAGFKYQIKSYFIGRQCIMRNLTDATGNIIRTASGIQIDVRADIQNNYSIIFTLVNKDKSTNLIGLAIQEPTIHLLGGGASSRPCPTHCPD